MDTYREAIPIEIKKKRSLFYTPHPSFGNISTTKKSAEIILIENLILEQRWDDSRRLSSQLIQQSLDGLHYLQTYDRSFIRVSVTAAYLGWMAYASLFVFRPPDATLPAQANHSSFLSFTVTALSWIVMSGFVAIFALQRSPWSFYAYAIFPCYFWQQFFVQMVPFLRRNTSKLSIKKRMTYFSRCAIIIMGLLIMAVCVFPSSVAYAALSDYFMT